MAGQRFPPSKFLAWLSHPPVHDLLPNRFRPDSATANRECYHSGALDTSGQYNQKNRKCWVASEWPGERKPDHRRDFVLVLRCPMFVRPHFGINLVMRIGTWNLDNSPPKIKHRDLLLKQQCEIWLLTEVNAEWFDTMGRKVLDFHAYRSTGEMSPGQYYAAVLSTRDLTPIESPHFASAAAEIDGIVYCSSVLPWRKAHIDCEGWNGESQTERTQIVLRELLSNLPKRNLVWGGDWNHSFFGTEYAGSDDGRELVIAVVKMLGLRVATKELLHRGDRCHAIDHIGVPSGWEVDSAIRIDAKGLSDHDVYVVEVSPL